MPITSVSYQRTYTVGPYMTEKIGVEASVDEGQDPKFVLAELKKLTDEVHEANNPHLQQTDAPLPPEPAVLPEIKVDRPPVDMILDGIMNAKDGSDLSGYKLLIKNNQKWTDAYQKRAKELGIIG